MKTRVKNGYNKEIVGATIRFHYGTSKARDSYGYNIVTLYRGLRRETSCNGGGYDMKGTCLGQFMGKHVADYFPGILKLKSTEYYGLDFYDSIKRKYRKHYRPEYSLCLDGGCGLSSMEKILNALGLCLKFRGETRNDAFYSIEKI